MSAGGLLLAADEVHQVGHVGLVEHGEIGRQTERSTVEPQQAIGDGVERAAPDLAGARWLDQAVGAREHLARGAAGKRQQQDAFGRHALLDQVGDATGERPGLAGAGAGDDQHRAVAARDRLELGRIERFLPVWRASGRTRVRVVRRLL